MTEDRITALEKGQQKLEAGQNSIFKLLSEMRTEQAEHHSFLRDIERHNGELSMLRDRSHDHGNRLNQVDYVREKVDRLELRADRAEDTREKDVGRTHAIEQALPNLQLASGWVFKAALALIALNSLSGIIKTISELGG